MTDGAETGNRAEQPTEPTAATEKPTIEFTVFDLDKIPKSTAVLAWENYLKRIALGGSFKMDEPDQLLNKDLLDSLNNPDIEAKSLASSDLGKSLQELSLYLEGKFEPLYSYLFKEKIIGRPKGYEEYFEYKNKSEEFYRTVSLIDTELQKILTWSANKLIYLQDLKNNPAAIKKYHETRIALDLLQSESRDIAKLLDSRHTLKIVEEEIEKLQSRINKLKNEIGYTE